LSEIDFPGWVAYLDGEPVQINTAHSVLRKVNIPAGEHNVIFAFRPLSVYSGLGLAFSGWLIILLSFVRKKFA
jgi:uncharacterized membrane protein YfhO